MVGLPLAAPLPDVSTIGLLRTRVVPLPCEQGGWVASRTILTWLPAVECVTQQPCVLYTCSTTSAEVVACDVLLLWPTAQGERYISKDRSQGRPYGLPPWPCLTRLT